MALSTKPPRSNAALIEVGIKGIGRIYLRDKTTDAAVLDQIFKAGMLDVTATSQFGWIKSRYEKAVSTGETPLIVDCGSNIGLSSLFFSFHLPKARVVAIEPARDNVEVALKNTAGRSNIETITAAVGDKQGLVEISDPAAEKWAYRVRDAAQPTDRTVDVLRLNDVMSRYGAKRILIAKIDIEGAEAALFRSNLEWLDRTDLLIIELHDWMLPGEGTSRSFFKALEGRNFETVQNAENMFVFFR